MIDEQPDFSRYTDSWGLICKRQKDGNLDQGDTAANEATRLICELLLYGKSEYFMHDYARVMDQLEYEPGKWRRGPDTSKWYAQPGHDRWSRDQSIPTLCLMALAGDTERARRFYEDHKKRYLIMMPNNGHINGTYADKVEHYQKSNKPWTRKKLFGDPTLLEYNALLIRACKFKDKYKWLRYFDFETLLGCFYKRYVKDSNDLRNHVLILITTQLVEPTLASKLSAKVYATYRMLDKIKFWWGARFGEPPIHLLLAPVAEKILLKGENATK